jgi:hypothetical protein
VVEPDRLGQPQPPHDGPGRFVEDRGQRPDLGPAQVVEGDADRGAGRLGGVPVMPGRPGQPPANLQAAGAGHTVRQRVETGEPDERAGRGHFQCPEAEPLPVETRLDHVDQRVAGGAVQRAREEPHGLGIGVQLGERCPVGVLPASHDEPLGLQPIESRHSLIMGGPRRIPPATVPVSPD